MGIGKPRPFLPPCAMTVSTRPVCSTVQSTANASAPIIEQFLAPTLKPGDVVILDNLGSHKGKVVRQAVRAAGARLVFLPKYSPDLNPIEQVFAKSKPCCERPAPEHTTLSPTQAQRSLLNTRPKNAPHTSGTQDMRKPKPAALVYDISIIVSRTHFDFCQILVRSRDSFRKPSMPLIAFGGRISGDWLFAAP